MDFLATIWQNLQADEDLPALTEIRDGRLVPVARREVREEVGRCLGLLRSLGVGPGDRVAFIGANSARWVAIHLALLAAEAVAVPVYHRLADAEMLEIIRDSGAALVLVEDGELLERLRHDHGPRMVSFCGVSEFKAEPVRLPEGERLVSIIYTSGSTGQPKGVLIHASNLHYLCEQARDLFLRMAPMPAPELRIIQFFPFAFLSAQAVMWNQLYCGANLYLANGIANLAGDCALVRPHAFFAVPLLLERIKAAVEARLHASARAWWLYRWAQRGHGRLASTGRHPWYGPLLGWLVLRPIRRRLGRDLRFIVCGTAPLRADVLDWFRMLGIEIFQAYGLTETTGLVSADWPPATPGSVGLPLAGCEVRVDGQGEILCRGPNIFRGYWNRPGTAVQADGWFHTGDLGRLDAQGRLFIEGRCKNLLVLSSGHNVGPEPVEAELLAAFGEAEHAIVVGHGRPFLCAILICGREIADLPARLDAFNHGRAHYRKIHRVLRSSQCLSMDNGLLTATAKLKRAAVERHFAREIEGLYGVEPWPSS